MSLVWGQCSELIKNCTLRSCQSEFIVFVSIPVINATYVFIILIISCDPKTCLHFVTG